MEMSKVPQYFAACPDSQIDFHVSLSAGPNGMEIDFLMEGTDEWGTKTHIVSGIEDSLVRTLQILTETFRNRAAFAQGRRRGR